MDYTDKARAWLSSVHGKLARYCLVAPLADLLAEVAREAREKALEEAARSCTGIPGHTVSQSTAAWIYKQIMDLKEKPDAR